MSVALAVRGGREAGREPGAAGGTNVARPYQVNNADRLAEGSPDGCSILLVGGDTAPKPSSFVSRRAIDDGVFASDPNQLPTPGDEDHERRAAEEYADRRGVRKRVAQIALICLGAAVVIVLVAHPWNHGTLTYHIQLSTGRMVTTLADYRSGRHTVQLVVRDPGARQSASSPASTPGAVATAAPTTIRCRPAPTPTPSTTWLGSTTR